MFSGIIEKTSKIVSIKKQGNNQILSIEKPASWDIKEGESINIDGVCSTIERVDNESFVVTHMPETLRKTTFPKAKVGGIVNLERSLRLNDLLGGHLVSGHIDTTAKVIRIKPSKGSKTILFEINPRFSRYLIYKGSIAINGVSLTVVEAKKNGFSVALIPYTLSHTNLGLLKLGDLVNIEVDMIAKYLEKLV